MIAIIVAIVAVALVVALLNSSRDARRTRESQERLEKHAIAQLPPPAGFDDCSPDVIAAVRENRRLQAIAAYLRAHKCEPDKATARIDELQQALLTGPELGRPRSI